MYIKSECYKFKWRPTFLQIKKNIPSPLRTTLLLKFIFVFKYFSKDNVGICMYVHTCLYKTKVECLAIPLEILVLAISKYIR